MKQDHPPPIARRSLPGKTLGHTVGFFCRRAKLSGGCRLASLSASRSPAAAGATGARSAFDGGAYRDRTDDLLRAKQALSHLS